MVRVSLWEAGGCQRLVEHLRMEPKTVAFQHCMPILKAFLTPVKNSSFKHDIQSETTAIGSNNWHEKFLMQ